MNIVNGNILNATEDIICHQVNCKGVMGAGLAKQIKNKYPEVFKEYRAYYEFTFFKDKLLGQAQIVTCSDGKIVANLFGQDGYGVAACQTDYKALRRAFNILFYAVTNNERYKGKSIAIPYGIGCGLAGGDWEVVSEIIKSIAAAYNFEDYTFYKL